MGRRRVGQIDGEMEGGTEGKEEGGHGRGM